MLRDIPQKHDPRLLIGSATSDDAGVFQISEDIALVQTVDFFTPIVDDAYLYGQIAAANSLSDVYAMGGKPLTAMNVLGMPVDEVPSEVIRDILRGGADKLLEVDCVLAGGHSIKNPEPIYGLSVTGIVHPRKVISNAGGRSGDLLILTKPLGTGIVTTGIKRGIASKEITEQAVALMSRLNTPGAVLAERGLVRAGTDVTGFGLLGHLISLCRSSGVTAEIDFAGLPVISEEVLQLIEGECIPGGTRANLETANPFVDWQGLDEAWRYVAADAQTSGGLLLCVLEENREEVLECLREENAMIAAVIGRLGPAGSGTHLIRASA